MVTVSPKAARHDSDAGAPLATPELHASRWLWWLAAIAASAGFAALHFS